MMLVRNEQGSQYVVGSGWVGSGWVKPLKYNKIAIRFGEWEIDSFTGDRAHSVRANLRVSAHAITMATTTRCWLG